MNRTRPAALLLVISLVAASGPSAFGQIKRPGPPTPWNLFGGNSAFAKARDATANRSGNRPNMERQPPLKRIGDPSNLQPEIAPGMKQPEAIKVAAQVKTEEDLKQQKIKGLKYLGKMGCGCYAKKYDIEGAFLEGLDDCNEEVRYAAVNAIIEAACGDVCRICDKQNCCTKKIVEKLAEMAYKQDKEGCWVEPSERVRQAAVNALNACYPHLPPDQDMEKGPGVESGGTQPGAVDPAPTPNGTGGGTSRRSVLPQSPAVSQRLLAPNHWAIADDKPATTQIRNAQLASLRPAADSRTPAPVMAPPAPAGIKGSVLGVDPARRLVDLKVGTKTPLPPGTRLRVYHSYLTGKTALTDLEVVESSPGVALATPLDMNKFSKVSRGDEVVTID